MNASFQRHYAQRLAAPGKTLLLFDEAEDLFVRRGGGGFDEPAASSRVFILCLSGSLPIT